MSGVFEYLEGLRRTLAATQQHGLEDRLEQTVERIVEALEAKHPLLICGNGASASDALRIAGELAGRYALERRGLKVIALTANPSFLTGWANDYAYDTVFSRQVETFGEPGAALLGITTSGNSGNVLRAFEAARSLGMTTIGLTGAGGGKLAALSDILIDVPERSTPRIQEVHVCLYHYLCEQVERRCAVKT